MPHLSPEQREHIRREFEGLTGAERTAKVGEIELQYNVNRSTVYRIIQDGTSQRQRRSDAGEEKLPVSQDAKKKMFALAVREMPASQIIEMAEINGWIAPGIISAATLNRWLQKRKISARQRRRSLTPHTRVEESFSNERHYIDISGFEDYFVDVDGSIGHESHLQVSKNRAGNRKPRLQFFLVVDGYSRMKYARFYLGKSALNWLDFMIRAWMPKSDTYAFPFQGRPHYLYSDGEGIFRRTFIKRFLESMDVHYHRHAPGESRAKGKVERPIGDMQSKLSNLLKIKLPEQFTLDEANAFLEDYLYRENGRIHSTTRQEPMHRWRSGFHDKRPLRLMPDKKILERYFYTSDERQIKGDLTIQLQGKYWQLPRKTPFTNFTGLTVPVFYHPDQADLKSIFVVLDDTEYEIEHNVPVPVQAGTYRTISKSDRQEFLEDLEMVDLSGMELSGYRERYAPRKSFLPVEGEALDTEDLALPRRAISRIQLIRRLQEEEAIATPPTTEQKQFIDELYNQGEVYEDDLDEIISHFNGPSDGLAVAI